MSRSLRQVSRMDARKYWYLILLRVLAQSLDILGLGIVALFSAMLSARLAGANSAAFFGFDIGIRNNQSFLVVAVIMSVVFVLKSVLSGLLLWVTTRFLARLEANAAIRLVRDLMFSSYQRVAQLPEGTLQWISSTGVQQAFGASLYASATLITEAALVLAILVMLFLVDPATSLLALCYFSLVAYAFQSLTGKRLRKIGDRISKKAMRANQLVLTLVRGLKELTVREARGTFIEQFSEARSRVASEGGLQRFLFAVPRFIVEIALVLGFVSLLAAQFLFGSGADPVVTAGLFLAAGIRLMGSLLPIQSAITEIRAVAPQAAHAQELLEELSEPTPIQVAGDHSGEHGPKKVSVEHASFSYRKGIPALLPTSFVVEPGQFVAIVGPSGAGKTTLVDLILGLLEPDSGQVLISGRPPRVERNNPPGSVVYLPQVVSLVPGDIESNLSLQPKNSPIDFARMSDCLTRAGLGDGRLFGGAPLADYLSSSPSELSAGQLQRLGVARALCAQPSLLVLDEPTSNLDPLTEESIGRLIESLRGEITQIVIAHRLKTIRAADLILVMNEGTLVQSGTFDELARVRGLFADLCASSFL